MPMCIADPKGLLSEDEREQLRSILVKLDKNKDNRLSWKEIAAAFKDQGMHMTRWRAIRAMHHADRDGDGFIDEDEMKEFVRHVAAKWGVSLD